jgi:hypothetical protein
LISLASLSTATVQAQASMMLTARTDVALPASHAATATVVAKCKKLKDPHQYGQCMTSPGGCLTLHLIHLLIITHFIHVAAHDERVISRCYCSLHAFYLLYMYV